MDRVPRHTEKFTADPLNQMALRKPASWAIITFLATLGGMTIVGDTLHRPLDRALQYTCAITVTLVTLLLTRSRLRSARKENGKPTPNSSVRGIPRR